MVPKLLLDVGVPPVGSRSQPHTHEVGLHRKSLADLRGSVPGTCPPTGPNSFIFAYIFAEKCPHWGSMPPLMGPHPPYGKSWIRHCKSLSVTNVHTKYPDVHSPLETNFRDFPAGWTKN